MAFSGVAVFAGQKINLDDLAAHFLLSSKIKNPKSSLVPLGAGPLRESLQGPTATKPTVLPQGGRRVPLLFIILLVYDLLSRTSFENGQGSPDDILAKLEYRNLLLARIVHIADRDEVFALF